MTDPWWKAYGWNVPPAQWHDEAAMIADRLEYLRSQIDAECISMSELSELQGLAEHIDPSDVQLLEWAGVPEFPDDADDDSDPLASALAEAKLALNGDSNDAEHDALYSLVKALDPTFEYDTDAEDNFDDAVIVDEPYMQSLEDRTPSDPQTFVSPSGWDTGGDYYMAETLRDAGR